MTQVLPPHAEFLSFAETLADASRAMLLKAAQALPEVTIKADASYVTTTDKAVEEKLREMIIARYPDHGIFGEEFENINTDAEFVWVLDPIDGTAAFVAGIPVYGTLIALAWRGKPFIGVIDHPLTDDRWTGVNHTCAFLNGTPVTTRPCDTLGSAYVTCSNSDFMRPDQLARFTRLRKQVTYVQYGGSCFSYGALASGRSDFAVDAGLDAFDVYACAAIIQGAGGIVTTWDGSELSFDMDGTVLAAGDKSRLPDIITALSKN
ncbi:histidinol-phosphatase, inositol monophosphatase family [Ruegeria halocynthiae]|uniref:Inositol-1-monophosphatase n=1 Tax=Ruegeria halocynthiae TaxID=985054 RepID=A0A1H3EIN4_9RHOB|nr:inositol monophosphatase family protein [Ruegeria halocynthiae]SDX77784.1 histidinol-phosphatase, inositol monophosphatase family [Ruegeria halocynthiae]